MKKTFMILSCLLLVCSDKSSGMSLEGFEGGPCVCIRVTVPRADFTPPPDIAAQNDFLVPQPNFIKFLRDISETQGEINLPGLHTLNIDFADWILPEYNEDLLVRSLSKIVAKTSVQTIGVMLTNPSRELVEKLLTINKQSKQSVHKQNFFLSINNKQYSLG